MKNLNDIARPTVENEWTKKIIGKREETDIEFDLAENLPSIYPTNAEIKLLTAIKELADELNWHTESTKRRLKTQLSNEKQILELNWDGEILTAQLLKEINSKYQGEGRYSGAKIAGFIIRKIGGTLRIENHKDGFYVVRNIVELPLNYGGQFE